MGWVDEGPCICPRPGGMPRPPPLPSLARLPHLPYSHICPYRSRILPKYSDAMNHSALPPTHQKSRKISFIMFEGFPTSKVCPSYEGPLSPAAPTPSLPSLLWRRSKKSKPARRLVGEHDRSHVSINAAEELLEDECDKIMHLEQNTTPSDLSQQTLIEILFFLLYLISISSKKGFEDIKIIQFTCIISLSVSLAFVCGQMK